MKFIKMTIVGSMIFGGLLLAAASCEACSAVGIGFGITVLFGGVALSNLWESEVCN